MNCDCSSSICIYSTRARKVEDDIEAVKYLFVKSVWYIGTNVETKDIQIYFFKIMIHFGLS